MGSPYFEPQASSVAFEQDLETPPLLFQILNPWPCFSSFCDCLPRPHLCVSPMSNHFCIPFVLSLIKVFLIIQLNSLESRTLESASLCISFDSEFQYFLGYFRVGMDNFVVVNLMSIQ